MSAFRLNRCTYSRSELDPHVAGAPSITVKFATYTEVAAPRGPPGRRAGAAAHRARKVFTKLEVASRRQLWQALPDTGHDGPMA